MTPSSSDQGSRTPGTLPCPHCGELLRIQYWLGRFPFRCTKCGQYSAFPFETRVWSVFIILAAGCVTVLLIKLLALDKASTFPEIGALVAILLGGALAGSRLVTRSARATARHLVKSRRPFWFPKPPN
jgi:uncharacterized protein (DUF983 family)